MGIVRVSTSNWRMIERSATIPLAAVYPERIPLSFLAQEQGSQITDRVGPLPS